MADRDDFTSTVDGAAGFERERALNEGDYVEAERPEDDWGGCDWCHSRSCLNYDRCGGPHHG